ncbi:fluoride efflux transporter CrcB [Gemmatimonas sp.]|uniref:fluoride efflux transporter CrcB n=1 Tax=Gemmatimonas sp. TaxID=1962908 RepID=UPI0031C066CD|nr:fluoride efflux transporter CrcB [Gemmatimonas sp.]
MNGTPTLATVTAVAIGGAAGSVLRYLATLLMTPATAAFPLATLLINVAGSFLLGLLSRLFDAPDSNQLLRLALTTGLCGGFTTFSTFSAETLLLLQQGRTGRAVAYIALSLTLGLGAAALGLTVGRK